MKKYVYMHKDTCYLKPSANFYVEFVSIISD